MFLSESIVRAIHADRVREIERATRERRLVEAASEPVVTGPVGRPATGRRMPPATRPSGLPV
ncbi:MAG TPA: hypothetical protein VFI34_00240 [Candidatus Limnocylindrales bacterium]|nr:hypothetical protein [Candidatus Limnocylindrales bacterium]